MPLCTIVCLFVTGFWKTDHFVTFDIIYISVYLRHSRWYYWFNKCLKLQMHTQGNFIYFKSDNMVCFPNPITFNHVRMTFSKVKLMCCLYM